MKGLTTGTFMNILLYDIHKINKHHQVYKCLGVIKLDAQNLKGTVEMY